MKYDEELNENEELEETSLNNEPDASNLASLGSTSDEQDQEELPNEPPKKNQDVSGEVTKKVLKLFLAKYKIIIIITIVVIIFLFLIILVAMDFDFVGTGNKKVEEYPISCTGINLVWENEDYINRQKNAGTYTPITDASTVDLSNTERFSFKNYSFDNYITNIVWNDNARSSDVNNKIVYQAMAIATRSRIVSTLPTNCVVLKDNNPENFIELTGSEEKYSDISSAVAETGGKIIGRDNTIINAKYDTFSYIKKTRDNEPGKEGVGDYYLMNENEQGNQIVPATWVIANSVPTTKALDSVKLESLSIYGSKYLLEKKESLYDLYRVLEYYYGRDIKYYSIGGQASNSYLSGCFWWPIGSDSTTVENGVIFAKEAPSTTKITSQFGYRDQPISGASTNHQAIDIGGGVKNQTNIIAVADGKVTKTIRNCIENNTSCGGGLGNAVYIEHNDGTITRYGHMSIVNVNNGDLVKQGQVIGKMGNTGNSTGTHLDFQVQINGSPVNPLNYVSITDPRRINCGSSGTGTYVGQTEQDFINFFAPPAIKSMHETQILASITIAQAILESGWGSSTLSKNYNNYFGMKAGTGWSGPTIDLPTTECIGSNCFPTIATWRVYNNAYESIDDHARLLQNKRYSGVVGEKDYVRAITIVKQGGYATDPNYISKVVNIIRTYNLNQFDGM